MEFFGG